MQSVIKQNPSFIGEDGDQIDVTFYPARSVGTNRRQIVEISKDNAVQRLSINPANVPDLIDALRQVYDQFVEFNEPAADAAE